MTARPDDLFTGDSLDRVFAAVGLGRRDYAGALFRTLGLLGIAWLPMAALSMIEGHWLWRDAEGAAVAGQSFVFDLATWAQNWGFIPLAFFAEILIGRRMRHALTDLGIVSSPAEIAGLDAWALRFARSRVLHWICVALAFWFSWAWARTEIANGVDTWHTVRAGSPGAWYAGILPFDEWFRLAGVWATFVALPIFTFLWLRWVWKIAVWTAFLGRVSRLDLRLMAVHPDRTGGIGCLSDVQTSFSGVLAGTGILVMAFLMYKLNWEGMSFGHPSIWIPTVVYIFLAPGVFLGPLFMFTSALAETKRLAKERIYPLTIDVAEDFRDRWLANPALGAEELLHSRHSSHLADLHAAFRAVREMRVVPFDRRSALELFAAAAIPFVPLAFVVELPERVRVLLDMLGGAGGA